jgi:hypothetical protein
VMLGTGGGALRRDRRGKSMTDLEGLQALADAARWLQGAPSIFNTPTWRWPVGEARWVLILDMTIDTSSSGTPGEATRPSDLPLAPPVLSYPS